MEQGYLKISSLCKYSDLSRKTVEKILKSGELPFIRLGGVILIKRDTWDEYLSQFEVAGKVQQIAKEILTTKGSDRG